ncbi:hypothetical protein [Dietzia alimentaria]|uniref:hypothetical protein n=1 Tax=Dietzia alimentaria TaxID=665550 RepID=UPI0003163CAC|nr:hypothetical protein [Dietzia alimentaria]
MARSGVRLKWNPDALYQLRSAPGVTAKLDSMAAAHAARAGPGYSWSSQQGARRPQGRWRAIVYPDSWMAVRDNAANNTLIRTMSGGG